MRDQVNDVTAIDLLNKDPSFAQWTRAKGFDTFGAFGPAIVTGLDVRTLRVRTLVNGPMSAGGISCSGMIFSPAQIVSAHLPLHDPDARRPDRLRHVFGCAAHEARNRRRGDHRWRRHPAQYLWARPIITRPINGSPIMRICVVGAGAIGGMLGVKLALSGHDVTLILRGANLEPFGKMA